LILHGQKSKLKLALPSDAPLILQWENNPAFWPITEQPGPFELAQIEEALHQSGSLERHQQARWIVHDLTMRPVGLLDLFNFDAAQKKAGIGILIGSPSDRQKGYASDAIRTLLLRLRAIQQIETLECMIHEDNFQSLHLFQHLGFIEISRCSFKNKPALNLLLTL
jgi:diamine N-acetyltransferase